MQSVARSCPGQTSNPAGSFTFPVPFISAATGRDLLSIPTSNRTFTQKNKSLLLSGIGRPNGFWIAPLAQNNRGPYRVNRYRPRIGVNPVCRRGSYSSADRDSRMSSKYIVPAPPPAIGLPLVPKPIVMVVTLVRSTPANSVRSITQSVHPVACVALASS